MNTLARTHRSQIASRILVRTGLLATLAAALAAPGLAAAQTSPDGYWSRATPQRTASLGARSSAPTYPLAVTLDVNALRGHLAKAQPAGPGSVGLPVSLPMPDGSFARFIAFDSPLVEAGLAASLPGLVSYVVQGIDDPSASGRVNLYAGEFHGIVISVSDTVYIDPYARGITDTYMTYTRRDYYAQRSGEPFVCGVPGSSTTDPLHRQPGTVSRIANGDQLRSYRIAIAGTVEFTASQGGATGALASVVDTVMRLNAIYERELAVHFNLIANNADIIFVGSDPYTNGNPSLMVAQNQTVLDTFIGSANFDIGHVIGTFPAGGAGLASTQSICNISTKARGMSGSSAPSGEPFVVDLMAHEIGHQFNANHTFNGSTGNCAGGNRNASTAWEPGSGTTLMSYAGICGAENIQASHDPYFHVGSLGEMLAWIGTHPTGSSCGTISATGNIPPVPDAGPGYTIPVSTPFTLAGFATDSNGDPLTYTWEQFDLGFQSPPGTDNGNRPLFRSSQKALDATRTFPPYDDILSGTLSLGETLPTTSRTLTFRMTARDNRSGGGGFDWDEVILTTTTAAGPFQVNSFNDGGGIGSGAATTIEWNVAGTDAAPVNCASVDIDLSTDSGQTFTTPLATAVSNDGSHIVTMPSVTTTQARIRIGCSDNIFFDVNDADFGIGAEISTVCATPDLFLGEATSASTTLSIAETGTILDVNISVDASMATFASTAGFSVSHSGTEVTLVPSNPNCAGNNIDVVFDDDGDVDIGDVCGGTPAISGIARPTGSLASFDTLDRAGTWTLNYSNNFLECSPLPCTGTLNEWCVTTAVAVASVDTDGDGISDDADNCTLVANPTQLDTNGDNIGNHCDADLTGDCLVNFADLAALKAGFFPINNPDADFTGDGLVNFGDLAYMKATFFNSANPGPGPSGLTNVCD